MAKVKPRTVPGEIARGGREDLQESQRKLADVFGISRTALIGYEQKGAPKWYRYALLGLAVEKLQILTLEEARDLARSMLGPREA